MTRELDIEFLQSLRDRTIDAWRRLQAARAIEIDQGTVLQISEVDFRPIRQMLQRFARIESKTPSGMGGHDSNLVPGEGNAGLIDQGEPEFRKEYAGGWCRRTDGSEIAGHKDVKTAMIYTHVMNRPGLAVTSPSDAQGLV